MENLSVENIEGFDKEKSTSDGITNKLSSFISNLEDTGLVSKQDVISLESFIGMPIITKEIHIDKLTSIPSKLYSSELLETCKNIYTQLTNIKLSATISATELVVLYTNVISELGSLHDKISKIKNIDSEVLLRLQSEKYRYLYNELTELYDTYNDPFIFLLNKYNFVSSVLFTSENKKSLEVFDELKSAIDELDNDQNRYTPLLLNILCGKQLNYIYNNTLILPPEDFTLKMFIEFYKSIDDILQDISNVKTHITDLLYFSVNNNMADKEINREYRKIKNFLSLLEDETSLTYIKIFKLMLK